MTDNHVALQSLSNVRCLNSSQQIFTCATRKEMDVLPYIGLEQGVLAQVEEARGLVGSGAST